MGSISRNLVFPAVAASLLAITGIVGAVTHSNQQDSIDVAKSRLSTVQSKLDSAHHASDGIRDRSKHRRRFRRAGAACRP